MPAAPCASCSTRLPPRVFWHHSPIGRSCIGPAHPGLFGRCRSVVLYWVLPYGPAGISPASVGCNHLRYNVSINGVTKRKKNGRHSGRRNRGNLRRKKTVECPVRDVVAACTYSAMYGPQTTLCSSWPYFLSHRVHHGYSRLDHGLRSYCLDHDSSSAGSCRASFTWWRVFLRFLDSLRRFLARAGWNGKRQKFGRLRRETRKSRAHSKLR